MVIKQLAIINTYFSAGFIIHKRTNGSIYTRKHVRKRLLLLSQENPHLLTRNTSLKFLRRTNIQNRHSNLPSKLEQTLFLHIRHRPNNLNPFHTLNCLISEKPSLKKRAGHKILRKIIQSITKRHTIKPILLSIRQKSLKTHFLILSPILRSLV